MPIGTPIIVAHSTGSPTREEKDWLMKASPKETYAQRLQESYGKESTREHRMCQKGKGHRRKRERHLFTTVTKPWLESSFCFLFPPLLCCFSSASSVFPPTKQKKKLMSCIILYGQISLPFLQTFEQFRAAHSFLPSKRYAIVSSILAADGHSLAYFATSYHGNPIAGRAVSVLL